MSESNEPKCATPGHISWNELISNNPQAAGEFYRQLFGWHPDPFVPQGTPPGVPPYTLFKINPGDERAAAGMLQAMRPEMPRQWVPYVVVTNADTSLAKAVALGAKVLAPVMAIGEVGRIALIQDPQGANIGLHELPN